MLSVASLSAVAGCPEGYRRLPRAAPLGLLGTGKLSRCGSPSQFGRSLSYGRKLQTKEQDLTTPQETDRLQSQLKEPKTEVKDRDTEIEALKAQVERMKEDQIEEQCQRVEAELAVLDARLEMTNFKWIIHSLETTLAEEKKFQEHSAGHPSPQLRQSGRTASFGQKPQKKLQHLTTPQEKDRALQRLQSQLQKAETKIIDRDTEIEALKAQIERMKEDWVEEECQRVETELALLEARKEIENLREVNESLKTSLAKTEKEFQKCVLDVSIERKKLESLLQSMEEMSEGWLFLNKVTSNGSDTVEENLSPAARELSEPVTTSSPECQETTEHVLQENLSSSQEEKKIIEASAQLQIEEEGKHEVVELVTLEATKETKEPQPEGITESAETSPGLYGQNNGSSYGESKASPPASPDSDPLTTPGENQRSSATTCQDDTAASASISPSGSDQGSDSSPELRCLGRSVPYGEKPQNEGQDLTTPQEKDILQSQLQEAETKIKDRDTEIEALKAQVERMKEDRLEEECQRVETELAVLDARLEVTNFKGIIHSLKTSLAEEKKFQEHAAGHPSPQLRQSGRTASFGQKPQKKLQHLTTPQEKDRALQRLQSQLQKAETKIIDRDTEIEALKAQVERMRKDRVEEVCQRVEAELAVLDARLEVTNFKWTLHSLEATLAEEEKKLQEHAAGHPSPQLRQLGRSLSYGQKSQNIEQDLTQEKDLLQSQLKEAETKIKDRDTEIEALKDQEERMKEDRIEEECRRVETEVAVPELCAAECPRQWPGCLPLGTAPISVH